MAARYSVIVRDTAGVIIAQLTAWRRLEYRAVINAPSNYSLALNDTPPPLVGIPPGQTAVADLFVTDCQIEVWRQDVAAVPPIPRYCDFYAFHRTPVRSVDGNGLGVFTSYGSGLTDLLARRGIWQYAGSPEADKAGPGETVMKEYVIENAGSAATSPPRVQASGVTLGLTVEADAAAGATWEGSRAWKGLLETVQEIGQATALDFGVVKSGAATFEFQARPIWGADRSVAGLNPATGLNAAGNAPVIFSLGFGNMATPTHSVNRTAEVNAVLALGQGLEADRATVEVTDPAAIAVSPWNRREAVRNANTEADIPGLTSVAEAALAELKARESFSFAVLESNSCRYGRDYALGDRITARYGTAQDDFQIVGVTVTVEGAQEIISVDVANIHD